jgi:cobalt/nickel transport system permease protein
MHIPDGYLGPATCAAGFAAMAPIWAIASKRVKKTLETRQVPLLAIGAAFSFVIMMFNVPIPGGTTGHAVGAVLVAILLGPWAAVLAVSVSLVIQALLFGDGGITAIGANCLNMAFVLPFVGYGVYSLIAREGKAHADKAEAGKRCTVSPSAVSPGRRVIAAGFAGYAGLVAASFVASLEFGIQPLLHRAADGHALYCPYGLSVTIPAMVGEHALVFGWVEFAVTALAVSFIQKQEPSLLERKGTADSTTPLARDETEGEVK